MYVFLREWLLIGKPDMYIITILAWYYTFSLTSQQILVDNKVYHQMRCECELDFHTSPFQEICLLKNPSENKNPFIWNFSWKKIIFFDLLTLVPLYRMTYADLQQLVAAASSHFEMHLLIFFLCGRQGISTQHENMHECHCLNVLQYKCSLEKNKKNYFSIKILLFMFKGSFFEGYFTLNYTKKPLR